MDNKENFNYTYSAKEQEEIKAIREKYEEPKEEDKMTRLRRLHASASKKAQKAALILGIIGALILGTGMSLAMTEFGAILGAYKDFGMLIGIAIGVIGIILVSLAYPLYNRIVKKERAKIAPEILSLTEELMN